MVREQEPARNPLMPSQAKIALISQGENKQNTGSDSGSSASQNATTRFSPQPEFGKVTSLHNNASPLSKPPVTRVEGQPVIRRSGDGSHSNLFAKKRPGDAGFYKPPSLRNPLSNLGRDAPKQLPKDNSSQRDENNYGLANGGYDINAPTAMFERAAPQAMRYNDPFSISQLHQTATQFRPIPVPQTFSSNINTNPYFQPATTFVDLTQPMQKPTEEEGFSDKHVFGNDRFGTTDPMMYIDSRQADDDIKALLEGAMDDEEDKPRTRRKKKQLEEKVNELTKKIQSVHVETEDAEHAEEEEEEEEDDDGTREGLKVKLLPHQIDGVEWMVNKERGTKKVKGVVPNGGILADDMGLGKTIQSLALILSNPRPDTEELVEPKSKIPADTHRATLVVAPLALIKQWEAEIRDRVEETHALVVKVHHGPQRTKSYKELRNNDVIITTYQTLSSEYADGDSSKSALFGVNWYRVILDEAHSIKNRNAKTTKAAYALNSLYRWCLTGTPMQNNLDELQSLIKFLRIKPFEKLEVWKEQITKPMSNGRGGLAIRRLRAFLSAFMKRRTKDVLKQGGALKVGGTEQSSSGFKIVKRTVEKVQVQFSEQERAFYKRLEDRTDKSLERMMMGGSQVSYASALVLLMRLRQACNHPQLLGADLSKEQTSLEWSRSPSKKGNKGDEMDDIANMLGGLSVENKLCDICQMDLTKDAAAQGMIRCQECEEDMKVTLQFGKNKSKPKKEKKVVQKERKVKRRIVVDSDDEDQDSSQLTQETETETESEEEFEESSSASATDDEDIESTSHRARSCPASSTKIRHLLKILKNDSGTHKYIVFSFFTSMLDLIEPFLHRHNLEFVRYDGSMRNDAREYSLEQLRNKSSVRILLCSLRAGSLGLNLTAASRVVILEPFWNPFVEEQAIDRVHRLNQTQDVIVHKLTIKGSVEERILELQERKREMANAAIEGNKMQGTKFTLQEMLNLFKHDNHKDAKLDMIGMKDGRSLFDRDSIALQDEQAEFAMLVSKKGGAKQKRNEDPVYGRRW